MIARNTARRLLASAIAFTFVLSALAPATLAQRRRTRARATASPASRFPRNLPAGTRRVRPPRTYDVQHYVIRTRFDVPNKTVMGDTTVVLKPLAAGFSSFDLDASGMQIEAVTLGDAGTPLQWTQPPDKLSIKLDRAYDLAETVGVRIRYRTRPERGLYFVPQRPGGGGAWTTPAQIWTQGEPEDNHHWFPSYDYPDDHATSEQYITTGADEIAISNGALVETIANPDGTRTFHWKMERPHASYLVSLVVGNYAKLDGAYKNVPLEYYTYRGTEETARRAFAKTPEMMRLFSEKLGHEYPYNRYAQTVVASFIFGGMENVTATTHADSEILYGSSPEAQVSTQNLISHELAHSWFGNLVTCKDWSELWLNEGFATFMEAVFREHDAGRDAYLQEMRSNAALYFIEDLARHRRPLVFDRYRSPIDLFDSTVYKKGALVLHMLRETVGDELFWKALHRYLDENRFKPVTTADLRRVFEETTGRRLDWFFDQWVYKAGFPELRVRSFYSAPSRRLTLEVTQTQGQEAMTPLVFRLPMEIEIATQSGARTERVEITERTQRFTFQLDGKPLMVRFDKGMRLLKTVDFPQPASMLKYQLTHSSDVIGRVEAAEALARLNRRLPATRQVARLAETALLMSGETPGAAPARN
ncbi:MAG TPA: M1 family aminopeptidase [Pyrinomonadaceae bacterium]|nr:M1 family aminopeptidase [Pyrinomonadaceae bacterium]